MTRIALIALLILGASVCTTGAPEAIIYANETWYRESAEPEREWRGTLRPRAGGESPHGRTSLRYELATSDGTFPVYAPTSALDRYANAEVEVRAKLVEMEGARELWIGVIRSR